ncbi:hypothetical protein X551_04748 [Methylibium sp. T29]|nr:hypothetical protein X551_04748 [Methylibium sp. T29]
MLEHGDIVEELLFAHGLADTLPRDGHAALGQRGGVGTRLRRPDGAHVHQQRAAWQRVGQAVREQQLLHDVAVLEHRDHELGRSHRRLGRVGHAGTGRRQGLGLGACAVPHGHVEAGRAQAARHRRAHQSGPEQGKLHR